MINGTFAEKHMPFAVDKPMRKPVYDPGPPFTPMQVRSETAALFSRSNDSINGASAAA